MDGQGDGAEPPPPIARDVEIGRRLYRRQGEVLIDGHAVRLRDVHDLLMDVGVGVKAARHRAGQDRPDPQLEADR